MNSGGNTGDAVGSVEGEQLQSHGHTASATDSGHTHGPTAYSFIEHVSGGTVTGFLPPTSSGTGWEGLDDEFATAEGFANVSVVVNSAGGTETRPVNAAVNYLIKD